MKKALLLPLAMAVAISGCSSSGDKKDELAGDNTDDKAVMGALAGAVIGGVIANNTGKQSGTKTALGVLAGAAAGGAIGKVMDDKEKKLRKIAKKNKAKAMEVERLEGDLLKVSVSSEASFDVGKSDLKAAFKPTLEEVAGVLKDDPNTEIEVVGHTDSQGSESYNQKLSEQRAESTTDYLVAQGVASSQITSKGRGESEPRADNNTADGRAQNRRVEIYLKQLQ